MFLPNGATQRNWYWMHSFVLQLTVMRSLRIGEVTGAHTHTGTWVRGSRHFSCKEDYTPTRGDERKDYVPHFVKILKGSVAFTALPPSQRPPESNYLAPKCDVNNQCLFRIGFVKNFCICVNPDEGTVPPDQIRLEILHLGKFKWKCCPCVPRFVQIRFFEKFYI